MAFKPKKTAKAKKEKEPEEEYDDEPEEDEESEDDEDSEDDVGEKEQKQLTIGNVLEDHERRLANLEAWAFRVKSS